MSKNGCKRRMQNKFTNRSIILKIQIFVLLSLFVLLAGCNGGKGSLPSLQGRYQGIEILSDAQLPVVVLVPDYQGNQDSVTLSFDAFAIAASSAGHSFQLTVNPKSRSILVKTSALADLKEAPLLLAIVNQCASSQTGTLKGKLCWDAGKLDLVIYSQDELHPELSLHLVRENGLPEMSVLSETTLDELLGRAKFLNYSVSSEAEHVFQARESIKSARGELLPKLSLRAVVGVFTRDYLSVVNAVLPFIFPNNWYRLQESQSLFQAEKNSFASLRGNEMNTVESLAYLIARDQALLQYLNSQIAWMVDTQKGLAVEEQVGIEPQGSAESYGLMIGALQRDQTAFSGLIAKELISLSQSVALSPLYGVKSLAPIEAPHLDAEPTIDSADFIEIAKTNSYELKTLSALAQAAKYQTSEITYGFLDPEGNGSLGFGSSASIAVGRFRQADLEIKKTEMSSLIEERAQEIAIEYNQAIANFRLAGNNFQTLQNKLKILMQRHLSGDTRLDGTSYADQLSEIQLKMIEFKSDQLSSSYEWLMAKAKYQRLLLQGAYLHLDDALPGKTDFSMDSYQEGTTP